MKGLKPYNFPIKINLKFWLNFFSLNEVKKPDVASIRGNGLEVKKTKIAKIVRATITPNWVKLILCLQLFLRVN